MTENLYASPEEMAALHRLAKPLGNAWLKELTPLRGNRMPRHQYERVLEVLQKATAAQKGPRHG